jgi:hypothetical protein
VRRRGLSPLGPAPASAGSSSLVQSGEVCVPAPEKDVSPTMARRSSPAFAQQRRTPRRAALARAARPLRRRDRAAPRFRERGRSDAGPPGPRDRSHCEVHTGRVAASRGRGGRDRLWHPFVSRRTGSANARVPPCTHSAARGQLLASTAVGRRARLPPTSRQRRGSGIAAPVPDLLGDPMHVALHGVFEFVQAPQSGRFQGATG